MKDKEQASPEEAIETNDNRLEAVRDLLFGPNDQAYRKEFKDIKKQLESDAQDAQTSVSDLREEFSGKLAKLEDEMVERFEALEARVEKLTADKTDKKQLAKLLTSIAKELES